MLDQSILNKNNHYFASMDPIELANKLESSRNGLTTEEANNRLKLFGKNTIKEEAKMHVLLQFLSNFANPLILILLGVAVVSFITGAKIDALIVTGMVLLSVTLNFLQEFKADKAAKKLKERVATLARVLRDGKKIDLPAYNLCVGDIIEFNAGDLIPADCRLITAKDFFVNQSALTGESFPKEKYPQENNTNNEEKDDTEYVSLLYSGTSVVTGSGLAIVIRTGSKTEFGKIAEKLVQRDEGNEFTKGVNDFSILILKVIIFFVLFIFIVNALIKHDYLEALLFSIAVAVGLTPEFLPMIMSVTMGKGSLNMAKKGVIVKKLSAIPTFGSLDILCTDKTGTLTQDKIKLVKCLDLNGENSENVLLHTYLNSIFQTGITNPMDDAIINFKKLDVSCFSKVDEIPFDFNRKRMSVVVKSGNQKLIITKGAPEEILSCCTNFQINDAVNPINANNSQELFNEYVRLSSEGYRVLAIAIKEINDDKTLYEKEDEKELTLIGYTAFLDPPKEGTKKVIDELEGMGIEIKILTGDNELIAKKICRDVDVNIKGILLGHELHEMSDDEIMHKVKENTIFARFSPDDKNRVIQALQKNGHVVGYMGDGINDAPSLKTADVGISVSNAVDVAKESADIILTKKSLDQLKDGVIEGRKTFGNTMKYIMMGLSSNFGNMFSVLGAVILLPFLPMLPIQILLNNFLYDLSQITIPTDNVDDEFVLKPKRWNIKFIRNFMFVFGPISSFYDFLTYFAMYMMFGLYASHFQTGWFMESLATQTLVIHMIRTKRIPFIQSKPSKYLFISTLAVVLTGWVIPFTKLGTFFEFSPLPFKAVIVLFFIVIAYLLTVEMGKRLFFKKYFDME